MTPVQFRKLAPEAVPEQPKPLESPLLTLPQAAAYAQTSIWKIRQLIQQKEIKCIKTLGKGFKIRKTELDNYFNRVEFLKGGRILSVLGGVLVTEGHRLRNNEVIYRNSIPD
jgi:excisionase family DNA binding protein